MERHIFSGRETAPEATRLQRYQGHYDRWSADLKEKCSWEVVQRALLANNCRYLGLAEGLHAQGILFGVDEEGRPLFADGGDGPILTGKSYKETRQAVREKVVHRQRVPIGYEMFPGTSLYEKSPEIAMFEAHTGKPFVSTSDGSWSASWLESGDEPIHPKLAYFDPERELVSLENGYTDRIFPEYGVRRLLRVPLTAEDVDQRLARIESDTKSRCGEVYRNPFPLYTAVIHGHGQEEKNIGGGNLLLPYVPQWHPLADVKMRPIIDGTVKMGDEGKWDYHVGVLERRGYEVRFAELPYVSGYLRPEIRSKVPADELTRLPDLVA
jgi:hypothetical protein